MDVRKILDSLYKETQTPMMAMQKVYMNNYMDFSDARECVHVVYQKRGYNPALDFINMLLGYDLISLNDRIKLSDFILVFENNHIEKRKQKKLAQKIRKNIK